MSHTKERKEKNCLNCNAIVAGRFCKICGQENIEMHETFGHLAGHFISDIFHFDGMFFSTSKYLLLKPGFLTKEYVRGRRASYLNPIKMYVFISAIFFLVFLNFFKSEAPVKIEAQKDSSAAEVIKMLQNDTTELHGMLAEYKVPSYARNILIKKLAERENGIAVLQKDTTCKMEIYNRLQSPSFFGKNIYSSKPEYDSMQMALPESERDGWLKHTIAYRNIDLSKRFRDNESEAADAMQESILHHFPQTLFISLPLFALLLQLLYVRHKNLYYANHLIYTVHLYCAIFVFMFITLVLGKAESVPYLSWLLWIKYAVTAYAFFYTFRALRVFYEQGFGKTLVKWLILNVAAFFIMIVLVVLMVLFSVYSM